MFLFPPHVHAVAPLHLQTIPGSGVPALWLGFAKRVTGQSKKTPRIPDTLTQEVARLAQANAIGPTTSAAEVRRLLPYCTHRTPLLLLCARIMAAEGWTHVEQAIDLVFGRGPSDAGLLTHQIMLTCGCGYAEARERAEQQMLARYEAERLVVLEELRRVYAPDLPGDWN